MGSFNDEYLKLRKKRLEDEEKGQPREILTPYRRPLASDVPTAVIKEDGASGDIAPVTWSELKAARENKSTKKDEPSILDRLSNIADAANEIGGKVATRLGADKEDSWFKKSGLWDDGYQVGDISKAILAGGQDLLENVGAGIAEMPEKALDALLTIAPYVAQGQYYANGGGYNLQADAIANQAFEAGKKGNAEIVKKDLYSGEDVAKFILTEHNPVSYDNFTGRNSEEDSVLGEKTDELAQSGGQLLGTAALQAVGVPAWLTIGATAMGGEAENALNNGATLEEAAASGLISAGAEILTEKISGGIDFGMGTLDDGLSSALAANISNKTLQTLTKLGVDMAGEGAEEVFSNAISAIGQKLTYDKEKDISFSELFLSEEAFENFIGGAVLGGVGSGGKAVVNTVKGNDAVTGLQKDTEQKVVDKLYKEAITEAEADGKKLTAKDKKQLYDGVLNNLEKGYISTDVIEEVLGGEDYKTYQSEIKRQQDLDNELNELRNMKSSEMTDIQTERMAELKAMTPNTEMVNALKFGIDEKIHNSIKDTKLVESYNEKARRGQTFEADLSKYDSKQAAVVQKAIDSGILNNTNRTHEFVDMVSKISADKGVLFDFTDNAKLKESGFSLDGKTINGYVTKDGVTLNVNSAKSLNSVVGHEIAHVLEGTELYAELSGAIVEYSKSKGDYQSRYDALKNLYKDVADADIDAELTADLVGDYLFTDENFVNKLSVQNKNVFKKLWDEIEYLYNLATAGSKEKRDLERVKKVFEKAYKQSGKASGDTKNSTKYSLALDNQENLVYNGTRGDTHARTDEFRKLQEASQRMSDEDIQLYHSGNKSLDDLVRRRFSRGVKSIFLESENNGVGYAKGLLNLTAKNNSFNIYEGVNASLFHDVFEMARNHLKYGELVDLHTVETTEDGIGYNDCYNYLSEDGLSGFSITPDGDLISVFNASGKSGFLRAIAPIVKEKAKTLDCYASENQNLMEIYSSIFGFKTASVMDYNMEYDHDNIAENHGMPQIAFMVNSASDVETKSFTKDEYDEAVTYRNSFVNQATDNEIAPIKEASSTDDVFFDGKNPKYSLSEYTAEEKKAHNDAVKNHFGKTYKWAETGYLLLDGTQLDLSGKHDGAPGGYRTVDHRDITEALGYDYGGGEYSDSLIQFMSEGNIRIIPECNGINLSVKPTKAQEQALSNYITRYRGEVLLDIDDLNGNTVVSVEYPYGTYYTKVLNDIREWFENGKKPENSSGYSLTKQGDTPKRYGSYNVYGKDIGLDRGNIAPMREDISKVENTHEGIAPMVDKAVDKAVDERVPEGFAPMEHSAMYESEVERVNAEMDRLAEEASRLYSEGKVDEAQVIIEQMQALNESGKDTRDKYYALKSQENADTEGYLNSLTDADAPPEIEAPYYEDGGIIDPFDEREYSQVGNQKVKSYMTENPEVKPYFQAEAERLLQEYQSGEKAHSIYNGWQKYEMTYDAAQDIPEIYRVKRDMSPSIAYLRDNVKMSYDDIEKGLKAIIEGNDNINTAAAKKVEVMLHDRLMNGYTDASGYPIPANQEYRDLIKSQGVLEGREEAFKQLIKDTNKSESAEDIAPIAPTVTTSRKDQVKGQQRWTEAIKPKGEKADKAEPRMKRADSTNNAPSGTEERRWVGTSTSSEAVDGIVTPDDIPDEVRYYKVKSNKKTLEAANARLARDGYAKSREYFESKMYDKKLTVEDIALGERLIQEAAKAGDAKAVQDLIIDVSIIGTELGQRVQALSIIQRLTPEGQLKALHRMVERGKTRGDKAYSNVDITDDITDGILKTYKEDGTFDKADLDRAVEEAKQKLADQMEVTTGEKLNAWRYLAMLGNPKTHIRNLVSNVAMMGTRAVKNVVARTIEDIAPIKTRTKTWARATEDVKKFAQQTTAEMDSAIKGDTKYSEESSIKAKRQMFKTKPLNAINKFNSDALEWEDAIFSKPVFRQTLQEYLTANGIKTEADILNNPEIVTKAREYALEEARRATFRQDSYLANKISEVEKKNGAFGIAIGSIMPFKKTPINIAKTGLSYSPLGFARNIYDAVQVKKGNMDASEAIDHLAQTLTGTSLTLIGYALASAGMLNGAGEDDKEGKYDYQLGEQSYSFNFGGDTYSLSWLSPVAMPLFVGANAYEKLVEGEEWDANVVIDTLAQTLDPLSEMSFLSSLDDVLSSYDSGIEKFMGAGESMIQNYATQFVPTLSSQFAATFDDTKRSTAASRNSGFKFGEETLNKVKYKIPGLRNTLAPTTDIWGNEMKQTENIVARGFESFFSPANKRAGIATAVDEELKSLYGETDDSGVLPSIPQSYINYDGERYDMSTEEYTEYKKLYGQTAYDLMEKLFNTETYKNASSEERADMVNRVFDYARDNAKKEYFAGIDLDFTNATKDGKEVYKENSIVGAIAADLPVDEYEFSTEYPEKYKFFKDNDLYQSYKEADEDGKRAYDWAFDNPGKYTMSKVFSDDFLTFYGYRSEANDIRGVDEDGDGRTDSGTKKTNVINWLNGRNDLDYGQKIILYRSMYNSKQDREDYNYDIIDYLNSRDDINYAQMKAILEELGMTVDSEGYIYWD